MSPPNLQGGLPEIAMGAAGVTVEATLVEAAEKAYARFGLTAKILFVFLPDKGKLHLHATLL